MGDVMVPDSMFWEWKLGEISLLMSAILVAFARPLYFSFKFLIYAVFASVSSWRWVVRLCAHLWMQTNWDIGTAIFGMVGNKWSVSTESGLTGDRQVKVGISSLGESGNVGNKGSFAVPLPEDTRASQTESENALRQSFTNIHRMDKREWYRHLFQTELVRSMDRKNARQLQKQARKK